MIYWQLIYVYLKIGLFGFGGGYAMLSLIQLGGCCCDGCCLSAFISYGIVYLLLLCEIQE